MQPDEHYPGGLADRAFLESAVEHRMVGLLMTLMPSGSAAPEPHGLDRLVELDYIMWARSTLLIDTCLAVAEQANQAVRERARKASKP